MANEPIPIAEPDSHRGPLRWLWPVVLTAAVLLTFGQCVQFDFLTWDDELHIIANERLNPLAWSGVASFWREPYEFLYIPLTYTLFAGEIALSQWLHGAGTPLDPALFHAASLLLHAVNALWVFALLRRWDHDGAAACAGALLFALHPLQVESVAWVSEQRGLLSATLSLAALWFYCRGDVPSRRDYSIATVAFVLAMLAKPSAMSVPFMAAAIDYGLLRRSWTVGAWRITPWFVLSAAVMLLTRSGQLQAHIENIPTLGERWWVAADAVGWYVAKVFWPLRLCFDEGRPVDFVVEHIPTVFAVLSLMPILLAALATAVGQRTLAAAAWIALAGLMPVMGFVPFAFQNISTVADRYAYLPLLGVGLALSHFLAGATSPARWIPAIAAITTTSWLSFMQAGTWRDSIVLYNHALEVNPDSWTAHHGLGNYYHRREKYDAAYEHFGNALKIKPNHARTHYNLGVMHAAENRPSEAEDHFRRAISAASWYSDAHSNLGDLLWRRGERDAALVELRQAVELQPSNAEARLNLARALIELAQFDEAGKQLDAALVVRPRFALAHLARARVWAAQERFSQAAAAARQALAINPTLATAHEFLGNVAYLQQQWNDALAEYDAALKIDARLVEASYNRGLVLIALDRKAEGIAQLERALQLAPPGSPTAEIIRRELQQQKQP